MSDWFYYTRLAISDLTRLWSATQHHVIIVTGICLPILLLMGLKQGHVARLRQDLLTSPTGRQVVFWSAQGGELLDSAAIDRLQKELPAVDVIIPETQRIVQLATLAQGDDSQPSDSDGGRTRVRSRQESITLYSTRPGDPILRQTGAGEVESGERSILLSKAVADRLAVQRGDRLKLSVERQRSGMFESASLEVRVKLAVDFGPGRSSIGFANLKLMNWLEQFVRGYGVPELGWPAMKASAPDRYAGYLAFCETKNNLTPDDRLLLEERGLQLREVTDDHLRTMYGLLDKEASKRLRVYFLSSVSSESDPQRRLALAPSEITEPLEADCVVVPWNPPVEFSRGNAKYQVIGLSMAKRIWLRSYLSNPDLPFDYEAEAFQARWLSSPLEPPASLSLPLPGGAEFTVGFTTATDGDPEEADADPQTDAPPAGASAEPGNDNAASDPRKYQLIVPANLTAWLDAHRHGLAVFDPQVQLFVPTPREVVYDKARLYARTIDDVPAIVRALASANFALMSENERITEIHQQDGSLQVLVFVVGVGVFLFGVVTVFSVLLDSTDRKRNTIGILRVMGVSKGGIFYIVIVRAAAIGVMAGACSVALGYLAALALAWEMPQSSSLAAWKPSISVVLSPWDVALVFVGSLLCSGVGAFFPAWKAARIDPFDAVVEGRFR